jgi:hypothetical protein
VNIEESELTEEPIVGDLPPEKETAKEPGPLGRFFTKVVRWSAGIGLVFGFGVVLTWVVRVVPLVNELRDIRDTLEVANAQITDLEKDVGDLRDVEQDNVSLRADLTSAELHIVLLNVLIDAGEARIALATDDPLAASAALTDTDELMASLQAGLEGENANTIVGLRVRLQQAISEIDTDAFAADGDLKILVNGLMLLEQQIFTE